MIKGIGIDIIDLKRIAKQREKLAEKILTSTELEQFNKFIEIRQIEYLAGRFASKEAYYKASNDRSIGFKDLEIIDDELGKPHINKKNTFISISHERDYAVAVVVIEEKID